MTAAVIQLLYGTLTRSPRPPPGRPQPWVAIVLFTVTVWALLPLAVKPAHSVGPADPPATARPATGVARLTRRRQRQDGRLGVGARDCQLQEPLKRTPTAR